MVSDILSDSEAKMAKAVEAVKREFGTLRTGRASIAIFDGIKIDYYGTPTPVKQMSSVSTPEPQLAVIQPWDKGAIPLIEKAIQQSDLGLNPSNDGNVIRVPFPPLSEDRRRDIVKVAHKMAEDGKVAVRTARHDARDHLHELEKEKMISEDDRERGEKKIQDVTDKFVKQIDELFSLKEKEIMTV